MGKSSPQRYSYLPPKFIALHNNNYCMNVYINSKPQEISAESKIADAFALLNITTPKGIAIAVNNNVIPKAEWDTYKLQEDDKVILIRAAQGG